MKKIKAVRPLPKKILFTPEGYQKLKDDFERYTQKRPAAVVNLRTTREMGDLSENAAYHAARFELTDIDRNLRRLTYLIRFGVIVEKQINNVVDFGSTVTLDDGTRKMTFDLVGGFESNPKKEKLSIHSPIGKAIFHKRIGDRVTVKAPAGERNYTIVEIS